MHDAFIDCANSELYFNGYGLVGSPCENSILMLRVVDDVIVPPRSSVVAPLALDFPSEIQQPCVVVESDHKLLSNKDTAVPHIWLLPSLKAQWRCG